MDTNSGRYNGGNLGGYDETSWHPSNIGSPASTGRSVVEKRTHAPLSGRKSGSVPEFRNTLATGLSQEGRGRLESETAFGTNTVSFREAEEKPDENTGGRSPGSRFFNGSLDFETHRSDRAQEMPGSTLYRELMESDGFSGVELPKTTEESQGTQGASHSLLEVSRLASYKKRPVGLEPTWYSWMRAGFRSSPTFKKLGLEKEKLRELPLPDAGQKSLPFRPSLSRPSETDWDSMLDSIPTKTSEPDRSSSFSGTLVGIFGGQSSFFGTEALSTVPSSFANSLKDMFDFKPFIFPAMRLSLIPTNSFGQTSSVASPTVSPEISSIFGNSLVGRSKDFGILNAFSDRAFTLQNYRGRNVYPLANESSVTEIFDMAVAQKKSDSFNKCYRDIRRMLEMLRREA